MTFTIRPDLPVPLSVDEYGRVRVGGTRVTLDTVITAYLNGATPEGIVESYPTLEFADVYATIAYYLRHREEVDAYLTEQEAEAARIRAECERRFPSAGLKERLLRRRAERSRT